MMKCYYGGTVWQASARSEMLLQICITMTECKKVIQD